MSAPLLKMPPIPPGGDDGVIKKLKTVRYLPGQVARKKRALEGLPISPPFSPEAVGWFVAIATNYDEHPSVRLAALQTLEKGIGEDNITSGQVRDLLDAIVYSDFVPDDLRLSVLKDTLPAVQRKNSWLLLPFAESINYITLPPLSDKRPGLFLKGEPMSAFQRLKFSDDMRNAASDLLHQIEKPLTADWPKPAPDGIAPRPG